MTTCIIKCQRCCSIVSQHSKAGGFTLIELLVVMAIIATLMSVVAPRYFRASNDAREAALKANLLSLREAIDHFHGDRGTYPETLSDLVDRRYIRAIPIDPISGSTETWKLLPPPERPAEKTISTNTNTFGKLPTSNLPASNKNQPIAAETGIYDVRSGSIGSTRDGVSFEAL